MHIWKCIFHKLFIGQQIVAIIVKPVHMTESQDHNSDIIKPAVKNVNVDVEEMKTMLAPAFCDSIIK